MERWISTLKNVVKCDETQNTTLLCVFFLLSDLIKVAPAPL